MFFSQRGMENLALLAVQAQNVISSGNAVLNATQVSHSHSGIFR